MNLINTIQTGDARELAQLVEEASCDLVFTDPIYENVDDYRWLGETAMRVLKDNSACLAWTKTSMADECKAAMIASGLRYVWTLYYVCSAKQAKPVHGGIFPWVTPCLLFAKGKVTARPYITDSYFSSTSGAGLFKWNKDTGVVTNWLTAFSKRAGLVFDPFTGRGTVPAVCKQTGRDFIAFEIDTERAEQARRTVEATPILSTFDDVQRYERVRLIEAHAREA